MQSNKVKLLSNYQLFQLGKNQYLDKNTLKLIDKEFKVRNISMLELREFQQQYDATFESSKQEIASSKWHPFITAFAWNRHFRQIALLKTQGSATEAKQYQIQFYLGMAVYMFFGILVVIIFG